MLSPVQAISLDASSITTLPVWRRSMIALNQCREVSGDSSLPPMGIAEMLAESIATAKLLESLFEFSNER